MPSVVVIHAAEDTLPARALAEKVRQLQVGVSLELSGEALQNAVKDAKVTIALWSPRSAGQQQLVDDAQFARGKTKLINATMQSAPAPEQFRNDPVVNLTGWRGEEEFPAWIELAKQVAQKAGVQPLPPPAPRPPSGFFQPGAPADAAAPQQRAAAPQPPRQQQAPRPAQQQPPRPAPQQAAPRQAPAPRATAAAPAGEPAERKGGNMGLIIGIIAFLVLALGGGGAYWFMTQQNAAHATAWEDVDRSSAAAIRAFLETNPAGEQRAEAQRALDALEQQSLDAARDANTIEGFEAFLRDFPDSDDAIFVQGQIQQLRLQQQNAPPAGETTTEAPVAEPVDPDLVPPGATAPPLAASGPAQLTPPASEPPSQEPDSAAPTN